MTKTKFKVGDIIINKNPYPNEGRLKVISFDNKGNANCAKEWDGIGKEFDCDFTQGINSNELKYYRKF